MKISKLSLLLLPVLGMTSCGIFDEVPGENYEVPEATVENYQSGWLDMKNHVIDNGVNGMLQVNANTLIAYARPSLSDDGAIAIAYAEDEYAIETVFKSSKEAEKLCELDFTLAQDDTIISTYTAITSNMQYSSLKNIVISPTTHNGNIVSATEIQGRLLTTKLLGYVTDLIRVNNLNPLYW